MGQNKDPLLLLEEEHHMFGPDAMPIDDEPLASPESLYDESKHEGLRANDYMDEGWFRAESNRMEQCNFAHIHLQTIARTVDDVWNRGLCPDRRWTNDPLEFKDPMGAIRQLTGSVTSNACIPFPPHDQQYFVRGIYQPQLSKLKGTAVPNHMRDSNGNSTWLRLVDFAPCAEACHVFDDTIPEGAHLGRVMKGALDNGYFVEALQAISLRPRLAKQLFYCWDLRRSIFVARIFKNGTWMRVEIDDYVPVGPPGHKDRGANYPICCRSDNFPYVMWPSLIEKAYAKVHTLRGDLEMMTENDKGGWEVLGGDGNVEEALADLTGGVAGRFQTADVTAERLFLYIYELQRDTLFLCRVNEDVCQMHGIRLNPYYANVVNRAVTFEGKLYVQMFCGAPGVYDGGLQDVGVPWALINDPTYPEKPSDGFYWITAFDFRTYFGTIFECRLVNSGDVALTNMPPPRIPGQVPQLPFMPPVPPGAPPSQMPGTSNGPWFETVYANAGDIHHENQPEFTINVPDHACPCEVVCSLDQVDPRLTQIDPVREQPEALLVKVYEQVSGNYFSNELVCKSNWIPCRDAMVAFCCRQGGEYKVVCELPQKKLKNGDPLRIRRMIFRAYSPHPNVVVSAGVSQRNHMLVKPWEKPKAVKWSFVGCIRPERYLSGEVPLDKPEPFVEHDRLRKAEDDLPSTAWKEFTDEVKEDCVVQ